MESKNKIIKGLKAKAKLLEPSVRIGKNGLADSVIAEIIKHLKKKQLVKVKMLSAFLEDHEKSYKKEAAQKIAELTNSELIDLTGFVLVIHRKRK
ncbi:MAG: YhbY family RNA-binding protein [Nanoarchaeota archaeon]|nr:YhbY family RNA-binding protein [Nanoarchaeota archaeon]